MVEQRVQIAREVIGNTPYITIATASKDGMPWNTPVFSAFDAQYNFFWASDRNAQHSKNIEENRNVFLAIYDSTRPPGTNRGRGISIQAKVFILTEEKDIEEALHILSKRQGEEPREGRAHEFLGNYPRRIYKAVPEKVWVNEHGDVDGNFIDIRVEIELF